MTRGGSSLLAVLACLALAARPTQGFAPYVVRRSVAARVPRLPSGGTRRSSSSLWSQPAVGSASETISHGNQKIKTNIWKSLLALAGFRPAPPPSSLSSDDDTNAERRRQWITLGRVGLPSVLGGVAATLLFPAMALVLASSMGGADAAGVLTVLSTDSSQFVQNFLTVAGLLFSILVGQTYCT
jgi:hypothetical protein